MDYLQLIEQYLAGPALLKQAMAGMTEQQLDAVPIPGKWSTRQVVCHIADFELIYADRMKRVIAEDHPTFFGGDPDVFAARLAYEHRNAEEELQLIKVMRRHMACILRSIRLIDSQRIGNHSEGGPITLAKLLQQITEHIPHHLRFVEQKRKAIG